MFARILAKIIGTNNQRQLKLLQPLVNLINELEKHIQPLTDEQLSLKTSYFREQISQGKTVDELLPEAYAVVREVARRTLGQRHYDVQLMGGIVLHQGKIAEMKTGEGKTLTATLPLYLNALTGKSVHLVTVNDYLAKRDAEWMSVIYNFLHIEATYLQNTMSDSERKKAYRSDIVYATNNELCFDYLRDNMKFRSTDYVQTDFHFAIVDEIDNILIDEARTPCIISGPTDQTVALYEKANKAALTLSRDKDFEIDEKARSIQLTEAGNDALEHYFAIDNLYALEHLELLHHVNQALKANFLFKRNVDYIVKDDNVFIVDEFTGRLLSGRRYSDGLHQALEAKEGVPVQQESQTLASITLQNYFRLYPKLSGMTGTAATEAEEFYKIYKLNVVVIPTNKPMIRDDKPDLIFLTQNAKYKAIIEDITERYRKGQPVLIGTIAIETSENLSLLLKSHGIPHSVLNAKQHEREAEIVAHAGQAHQITIATNMAGRGTDIQLSEEARAAGGLYILGTERHESRRIDNQLRGRSGRQGDPGESRFYISLEDDLIRIFAGDTIKDRMIRFGGMSEDEIIESRFISRRIEDAQEKLEKRNFEIRKHLLEYDDVLNQQRTIIYKYRRDILSADQNTHEFINDQIIDCVHDVVTIYAQERTLTPETKTSIIDVIASLTEIPAQQLLPDEAPIAAIPSLEKYLADTLVDRYALYRAQYEPSLINNAEKWFLLETIDQAWKHHMLNLDHLKEGVGLRGWGQKSPLAEYKKEAFEMFEAMIKAIRADVIHHLFHVNLAHFDEKTLASKRTRELEDLQLHAADEATTGSIPVAKKESKIGRNDPCSCGSGKKFKKCCGI
ncbi:MAG: preprotein translocase subunit SecA [Candidatus Babeliales bacterium]